MEVAFGFPVLAPFLVAQLLVNSEVDDLVPASLWRMTKLVDDTLWNTSAGMIQLSQKK